jgi:hypothetical protein
LPQEARLLHHPPFFPDVAGSDARCAHRGGAAGF